MQSKFGSYLFNVQIVLPNMAFCIRYTNIVLYTPGFLSPNYDERIFNYRMVQQTLHEKVDISLKPNKMLTRNLTFFTDIFTLVP